MAVDRARAKVWLVPSHTSPGASAPVAVSTQAPTEASVSVRLRPRRSDTATMSRARRAPTRTPASMVPISPSVEPKSDFTNVFVWVSRVPR